jgi:LmbE family N-acetylglucosaminyl deacetylase
MTGPQVRQEHVLFIFAHPDDETFGCAGLLTLLRERGATTSLVVATRGEVGEIRVENWATPETLGPVREAELRSAMDVVGLTHLRLLGYRDSGMAGTPPNEDRRAFVQADRREIVAHLVGQIRDLRPTTVITFGPDGIYGHPDHILIHETTVQAVDEAASETLHPGLGAPWRVPALFFTAIPRERVIAHAKRPTSPFNEMSEEELARFGTPEREITHRFDVSPWFETKRRAMQCHRTQIAEGGAFDPALAEEFGQFWTTEFLRRIRGDDNDSPILESVARAVSDDKPAGART